MHARALWVAAISTACLDPATSVDRPPFGNSIQSAVLGVEQNGRLLGVRVVDVAHPDLSFSLAGGGVVNLWALGFDRPLEELDLTPEQLVEAAPEGIPSKTFGQLRPAERFLNAHQDAGWIPATQENPVDPFRFPYSLPEPRCRNSVDPLRLLTVEDSVLPSGLGSFDSDHLFVTVRPKTANVSLGHAYIVRGDGSSTRVELPGEGGFNTVERRAFGTVDDGSLVVTTSAAVWRAVLESENEVRFESIAAAPSKHSILRISEIQGVLYGFDTSGQFWSFDGVAWRRLEASLSVVPDSERVAFLATGDGRLVVATSASLEVLILEGNRWTAVQSSAAPTALGWTPELGILAGFGSGEIARLVGDDHFESLGPTEHPLEVRSIAATPSGFVWSGTKGWTGRYEDGRFCAPGQPSAAALNFTDPWGDVIATVGGVPSADSPVEIHLIDPGT